MTDEASCGRHSPPPTLITYNPKEDRATVWLKGGSGPGEIVRMEWAPQSNVAACFDARGYLVAVTMPGEALHPDLGPTTLCDYPAAGNL